MYLYELKKQVENRVFGDISYTVWQRVEMNFIFSIFLQFTCCVYLAMSKSQKEMPIV
jgi:hypothetical protein